MNGVNNVLVRKRKGVLVAIAVVIVLAALMYALVVYTNVRREKAYDTMEKEIFMAAKKLVDKEKPFNDKVVFSIDLDASKLVEAKYLASLKDPADKKKTCKSYVNISNPENNKYEYIVLLECSQYKNKGVKFDADGEILDREAYGDEIPNFDDEDDNTTSGDSDMTDDNNTSDDNIENDNVKKIEIIDRSDGACNEEIEYFYEDSEYKYYFACVLSPYIFVVVDGTEYNIKTALNDGIITIEDLYNNNCEPFKEKK